MKINIEIIHQIYRAHGKTLYLRFVVQCRAKIFVDKKKYLWNF